MPVPPLTHPDFPADLTEGEEDAGFKTMEIENPHNGVSSAAYQFYTVVAFEISETDIIIKRTNPFTESPGYKHFRYGTLKSDEGYIPGPPEWRPVGNTIYSDPARAVQEASLDLDDDLPSRIKPIPFPRPSRGLTHPTPDNV
jgi:hypothetical protein